MKTHPIDPAHLVANSLTVAPALSVEAIFQKFLIRWKFFTLCVVLVPAMAVSLSYFVPSTYMSSAQLLIRHQDGPDSLYAEITQNQDSLSGASSAEILRSAPVVSEMIEKVGVEDRDVPRPAFKVLFGKLAAWVLVRLGIETGDASAGGLPTLKYEALAKELKPSIEAATLVADRGGGPLRDELIEVKLKSTNREKVAAMVNGLCESYIKAHNIRARTEILGAHKTLGEQAAVVEAEIDQLHQSIIEGSTTPAAEFAERIDSKPFSSSLARTLSDLELRVVQLKQNYTATAPVVIQAQAELDGTRAMLANQQAVDAARDTLNTIKKKQRQLLLAAKIVDQNQGDISIVEWGLTPRKTKMTQVLRFGVPLIGGLLGGVFVGMISLTLLNLLDPRLYVASDISPLSGLPLLGIFPSVTSRRAGIADVAELPTAKARPALLQVLGKLDVLSSDTARVIVVTSAENESATASIALQLSALLAHNREGRILLIDANFDQPALTVDAGAKNAEGLIDLLSGTQNPEIAIRATKSPRLSFLGVGALNLRDEVASTRESWVQLLVYCRRQYRVTVLNTGGLLNSREAAALAKAADCVVLATTRRGSKKDAIMRATALLRELGAFVLGIIHCQAGR